MTSVVDVRSRAVLRTAAVRATLAPSVRNTQPWSLRLHDEHLDLHADRERQLQILDPSGRQLAISCGAALFNARLSLAAAGFDVRVDRLPDRGGRDIVARISALGGPRAQARSRVTPSAPASLTTLEPFIDSRHTNRHQFSGAEIPAEVLVILRRAVADEQCELVVVTNPDDRAAIAALDERARTDLEAHPAYQAEARGWAQQICDPSCGVRGAGCMVIIGSAGDGSLEWLHAGEALERMLLETTRQGLVTGPISQTIVSTADRAAVRAELGLVTTPQLVLRIGRAAASPASRRRRLIDVLVEDV